jgi:protein-L-isoaspartate O-methyltransferase
VTGTDDIEAGTPGGEALHPGVGSLVTGRGREALVAATALDPGDPLAAAAAMRRQGYEPPLAAAALRQAALRARAATKFGPDAARMFFTADGLQQATRPVVADRRAARLAAAGIHHVTDLCCGIGSDALAFARTHLAVHALDLSPEAVAAARANAEVLGLADKITVKCADATTIELPSRPESAIFCDPARRSGGRRVFDPDAYSPPWSFLMTLVERPTCLKLGPGIDHDRLPAGAEAEWVSVAGEVVEAALWCGPLAHVPRRATVIHPNQVDPVVDITGVGDREAEVGPVRRYLYDPDGAVIRAHLVAELGDQLGATIADPTIAYLYGDRLIETPFAKGYEITDVLPFSVKRLRALVRERGIGQVTVKKRGSAVEPEELRQALRPALRAAGGGVAATIVLTRVAGKPTAILCRGL